MEKDSQNPSGSEVNLPEVLWGQEIHWGLEVQGDPKDRARLNEENGQGVHIPWPPTQGERARVPLGFPGEHWRTRDSSHTHPFSGGSMGAITT